MSPPPTTVGVEKPIPAAKASEERSRRLGTCSICCIILLVVLVLGLGLGIGLGIGLRNRGGDSGDEPSSPQPPVNNTNATTGDFWRPTAGISWQIVLQHALNDTSPDVSVYDIDLFDNPPSTIAELHEQNRKVICYFSAGSYEENRPDSSQFTKEDYRNELKGWPGEYWLNTSSPNVRNIMTARLQLAASKGCDGVDPDNVDGYDNDSGLPLSTATAVDYLTFLAIGAHSRNMSIGLKNSGAIVNATLPMMQWQVNEQCVQYDECAQFQPFIAENKPVFHIEYPSGTPSVSADTRNRICENPEANDFSTVIKQMDLGDWLETC